MVPLTFSNREQFIKENQDAFRYGATEEFELRNERGEEGGEIISRTAIERSIDKGEAYQILYKGETSGGLVIRTEGERGYLELLFVSPNKHNRGIGGAAWREVERMYPEVRLWETCTPCFEKRNIHFYVNRCGFKIAEFFNAYHRDPREESDEVFEMFRFEKEMKASGSALSFQSKADCENN